MLASGGRQPLTSLPGRQTAGISFAPPGLGVLGFACDLPGLAAPGWDRPVGVEYVQDDAYDMRWLADDKKQA